jgi:integrase
MALGQIEEAEAHATKGKIEYLLMRIKQRLLDVPACCDIVTFLQFDGKPPDNNRPSSTRPISLGELRDAYLDERKHKLKPRSLGSDRGHWQTLVRLLGEKVDAESITFADLQRFVHRRIAEKVEPTTAKKELVTLRTSWNWAIHNGKLATPFPGPLRKIDFPPGHERPPFMTFAEIESRIAAGESEELWESVFLTREEVDALLDDVQRVAAHPWIYPLATFAVMTGARRGELIRVRLTDLDLTAGTVLIRETKRRRNYQESTRRVPLSPRLKDALTAWGARHPGGPFLFTHKGIVHRSKKRSTTTGHKGEKTRPTTKGKRYASVVDRTPPPPGQLTLHEIHDHFCRTLEKTRWAKVRLHALRHSFISNCAAAGVDQRIIDGWVGHTSEEMRRRYRHLIPSVEQVAIATVFGRVIGPPSGNGATPREG